MCEFENMLIQQMVWDMKQNFHSAHDATQGLPWSEASAVLRALLEPFIHGAGNAQAACVDQRQHAAQGHSVSQRTAIEG